MSHTYDNADEVLAGLRLAASEAWQEHSRIKSACQAEIVKSRNEIEAKYSDLLKDARVAHFRAECAVNQYISEAAKHPLDGKRVYKMQEIWKYGRKVRDERLDGQLEVVRIDSDFSANLSKWSRPSIGAVIIRKIKKDGNPSLQYYQYPGNIEEWQPV